MFRSEYSLQRSKLFLEEGDDMRSVIALVILAFPLSNCASESAIRSQAQVIQQSLPPAESARLESARAERMVIYPPVPGPSPAEALLGQTYLGPRFNDCVAAKMNINMPPRPAEVFVEQRVRY
jgi:hypothetical protein